MWMYGKQKDMKKKNKVRIKMRTRSLYQAK